MTILDLSARMWAWMHTLRASVRSELNRFAWTLETLLRVIVVTHFFVTAYLFKDKLSFSAHALLDLLFNRLLC